MKKTVWLLSILLIFPIFLCARDYDYQDLVNRVKDRFESSVRLYEEGKQDEAQEVAQSAYFELFENLEGPVRINVSSKKAWNMERKFTKIRNLIKNGAAMSEVRANIDSLNADMDEVLPKLQSGVVIVAEESSDTAQSAQALQDLDIRWQTLYDNIEEKFDKGIEAFALGDKNRAKEIIRSAQFEDYRNGMMEVAIRKHLSQARDGQIQNEMRRIIISIDSLDDISTLQSDILKLKNNIYLALGQLPASAAELAVVDVEIAEEEIPSQDYFEVLANIKAEGEKALDTYRNGDVKKAMSLVQNAYFDIFEASGMEVRVGAIDGTLKTVIEGTFSEIVAIMKSGGSIDKIEEALQKLYAQVEQGAQKLSSSSTPWSLFIYSLIIILREGAEALIIIAAVIAYLVKSGNEKKLGSVVHSSFWSAIGLSFVTAFVMNYLFNVSGESAEMLEGITMLVAVGLLFYVGFWLLSNAHAKKWSQYITGKVKDSISSGSAKALWFTVFLAVYREGAETVLFYQALLFDAKNTLGYSAIAMGFAVGAVLLVILFFFLRAGAVRIPIKPFFVITSAIIFYMSVVFTGKGIMELVEGKIIEPTIIEGLPTITWLGIYPYIESLLPQTVLIFGIIAGTILIRRRTAKSSEAHQKRGGRNHIQKK
ncbi:MAG: FTR1 family iron permease [Campylobacteraceae bacterium]|jgi:FTR1 family protein|nr:FTR1 family iron permease [Campylobacteraceae bacterium]